MWPIHWEMREQFKGKLKKNNQDCFNSSRVCIGSKLISDAMRFCSAQAAKDKVFKKKKLSFSAT